MPLSLLDHVTIHCADLAASRAFYAGVLELADGARPAFNSPGAWLYLGGKPVVHLVAGENKGDVKGSGSLDHIAFDATDLDGTRKRLAAMEVPFIEMGVPGGALYQVFLHDPDGVKVELNFRL
jgi:catechol 2,3-dioxygenase-like lactoylglutathione lyase family enzyme